jgi:hypothetical protein
MARTRKGSVKVWAMGIDDWSLGAGIKDDQRPVINVLRRV